MDINEIITTEAVQCVELKDYFFAYQLLSQSFARQWHLKTLLSDADGVDVFGDSRFGGELRQDRREAIAAAVKRGGCCGRQSARRPAIMIYAVPLMFNGRLLGGVVVEYDSDIDSRTVAPEVIDEAMWSLRDLVCGMNLANEALLERNKKHAEFEAIKNAAPESSKGFNYKSLRDFYLVKEPALLSCVKRVEPDAALEILNEMVGSMCKMAGGRLELLKTVLLELAMAIARTTVEAGGSSEVIISRGYNAFTELAALEEETDMYDWIAGVLDLCIQTLLYSRMYPNNMQLAEAIKYMKEHLKENMLREDVAEVACLSPSHFSRVIRQTFDMSFTEVVSKFRIDKAKELLLYTDMSLVDVAHESGFNDQSYFTKVFLRFTKQTPGQFRRMKHKEQQDQLGNDAFERYADEL